MCPASCGRSRPRGIPSWYAHKLSDVAHVDEGPARSAEAIADGFLAAADGAGDPVQAARLITEAMLEVSRTADASTLAHLVRRLTALRSPPARPQVEFLFHVVAGVVGARTGRPEAHRALDLALRLFATQRLQDDPLYLECAITATLTAMRPDEVRPAFAGPVAAWTAERSGDACGAGPCGTAGHDEARRVRLTAMLGLADAWSGELLRGRATLRLAHQYAIDARRLDLQAEIASWLIKIEALCGDLDASARCLEAARELAARSGSAWVASQIAECVSALHLATGDIDAWVGVQEHLVRAAVGTNSGLIFEHRWELATYHALRGDAETARELLSGTQDPPLWWPGAPALPAWRAWVERPDDVATMAWLETALAGLNRPVERMSRARLAWLVGAHHARLGRRADAVRLLEAASSWYGAMGAAGFATKVAAELHRVTAREAADPPATPHPAGKSQPPEKSLPPATAHSPRMAARLTPTELRVADMVAEGLSNHEAAQRLSVSAKTIEFHLGNIFRKLGIRNRTELARTLIG